MADNISDLECGLFHWTEDQPVTRPVRKQMETDGLLQGMIARLQEGQDRVTEVRQYGHRDYACLAERYQAITPAKLDPTFKVFIKPSGASDWDAIAEVYVGENRDEMKKLFDS